MILILGDCLLDKFFLTNFYKKSPEANIPIVKFKKEILRLGGAANLANNINTLDKRCILVGRKGSGDDDKKFIKLLRESKIKNYLVKEKNYQIGVKKRFYINGKQNFRLDEEKIFQISNLTEKKIYNFVKNKIDIFEVLVISDYNKGVITKNLIQKISLLFNRRNKTIISNPKKKNIRFYNGSNIIVPNEKEFHQFFFKKESFKEKLNKFFSNKFLSDLIITRGAKKLLHINKFRIKKYYKVKKTKVLDVTGASDTFIAILALNILQKKKIHLAIKKAIVMATKVVQKSYTAKISKQEYSKL